MLQSWNERKPTRLAAVLHGFVYWHFVPANNWRVGSLPER
jgi:hypothetical protein